MILKVISTGSSPGNCYALQSETGEILLLDCGCEYKKILRGIRYDVRNVCGCLLTHAHKDHSKSFQDLMNAGIEVYTNDETVEELNVITGELMLGLAERKLEHVRNFGVMPFYVPHDGTPNFAFLIWHEECGLVLYATDFLYLPLSLKGMKINHFLLECNHMDEESDYNSFKYEHSIRGHSSLSTVKSVVSANRTASLRTVTLCHLSGDWANPEVMQKEIQEVAGNNVLVQVARPGLEIDLNLCPF